MVRASREVVICDASVALAWLLEEPTPAWVAVFRDRITAGRVDVRVPALFWLEVGNRLMRRRDAADEQILEGFIRLEALGFETVEMDRPLRLMALDLARRFRLSTYDALYLALAVTADMPIATLDGRLADAATKLGRRYGDAPSARGSRRAHETPAVYGADQPVDRTSLAALGAYLAELRRGITAKA